jgi:hypothetical protein
MSGTRDNKIPPEIVTQEATETASYSDTEIELGDFISGDTFTEFEIKVNTIFNGGVPAASIGIDSDHEKYLTEAQCDLTQTGTYIIEDTIPLASDETIKAYVDGDGATEGSLTATVRFLDT